MTPGQKRIARLSAYAAVVAILALVWGVQPSRLDRKIVLVGYIVVASSRLILGREANRDRYTQIADGLSAALALVLLITL